MAGKKPEISQELKYLRLVVGQEEEKDDPRNVKLKNYRQTIKDNRQWVLTRLATTEAEFKDELLKWNNARKKRKVAEEDGPLEPCEVLVAELLDRYQATLLEELQTET